MPALTDLIRTEAIRNFFKVFFSSLVAQSISFALAPVLSRLFTPEDFGLVALYLGILSLLSVLSTGKYEQAIMLPKEDRDAVQLVWLVLLITGATAMLTGLVVTLFNLPLTQLSGNQSLGPWLYALPFSVLLHGIFQSAVFYANRKKRFGLMGKGTLVQYGVLNLIRILSGWIKTSFNGLIAGHLAAQLAVAVFVLRGIIKDLLAFRKGSNIKDILKQGGIYDQYPRYNLVLSFTNNLSGSLPVFMFTWGFSPEIAGLYAFGYAFVFRPLSLFAQSTTQVLSQKIIEDHHRGLDVYPTLKKLATRFLLFGLPAFIILAIAAPAIFGFVFSDEYARAGRFLQILSPYLLMVFITSPLSFVPELYFRQRKAMTIDIIYLCLRFLALWSGIRIGDVQLALALFSAISTLVVSYNLFWYLSMARHGGQGKPGRRKTSLRDASLGPKNSR